MAVKFVTSARTGRGTKRVVTIGSLAAVLITALMVILSILDVVSGSEMRKTLGKSLSVVGVSTLAVVLLPAFYATAWNPVGSAGRTINRQPYPM